MTAYLVAEVETTDEALADEYRAIARQAVAAFGGRYVVRNEPVEPLEGKWDPAGKVVILAFDSREQARRFYESEIYRPAIEIAARCMVRRLGIVDAAG